MAQCSSSNVRNFQPLSLNLLIFSLPLSASSGTHYLVILYAWQYPHTSDSLPTQPSLHMVLIVYRLCSKCFQSMTPLSPSQTYNIVLSASPLEWWRCWDSERLRDSPNVEQSCFQRLDSDPAAQPHVHALTHTPCSTTHPLSLWTVFIPHRWDFVLTSLFPECPSLPSRLCQHAHPPGSPVVHLLMKALLASP